MLRCSYRVIGLYFILISLTEKRTQFEIWRLRKWLGHAVRMCRFARTACCCKCTLYCDFIRNKLHNCAHVCNVVSFRLFAKTPIRLRRDESTGLQIGDRPPVWCHSDITFKRERTLKYNCKYISKSSYFKWLNTRKPAGGARILTNVCMKYQSAIKDGLGQ